MARAGYRKGVGHRRDWWGLGCAVRALLCAAAHLSLPSQTAGPSGERRHERARSTGNQPWSWL